MTTNTKAIIDKNKRHILRCYEGKGGATQFVADVDHYTRSFKTNPYNAILNYVCQAPDLLWKTADVEDYLVSLGFDRRRVESENYDSWYYYTLMMARDGVKLYEDLKKKGVEKTRKAIAVKKKTAGQHPFGL